MQLVTVLIHHLDQHKPAWIFKLVPSAEFDLWPFRVNVIVAQKYTLSLEISVSKFFFPAFELLFAASDYASMVSEARLWCQSDLAVCHSHFHITDRPWSSFYHTVNFKGQEEEAFLDVSRSVIMVQDRHLLSTTHSSLNLCSVSILESSLKVLNFF